MGFEWLPGPEELDVSDWMARVFRLTHRSGGSGHSFGALDDIEAKNDAIRVRR